MTDPGNAALSMAREHLECSAKQLHLGLNRPQDAKPQLSQTTQHFLFSAAYGSIAFLLHEFHKANPTAAEAAARELHDMNEAGESFAEWVSEQLTAQGVDMEALFAEAEKTIAKPTDEELVARAAHAECDDGCPFKAPDGAA